MEITGKVSDHRRRTAADYGDEPGLPTRHCLRTNFCQLQNDVLPNVRKFFDFPLESADLVTKDDMTLAMNDNHISHHLALQDQLHWATTYHSCLVPVFDVGHSLVKPKSNSFVPDLVSMTLPGFRSRCVMPLGQIN